MVHVGLEVPVAEEQRQVGLDAGGGDDSVKGLAHGDPLAAQLPVILRCLSGVAAAEHRQQGQRAELLSGGGDILVSAEPLHHLHQDEVSDRQRSHPEQPIQPFHLWGVHPTEEDAARPSARKWML